ncbi:MAG: hypothetical protein DRJ40_02670 [Thermoprotei archaeon]|nr:MAG: hypothetical protein DRJ40_02670 [Thermoprotei archaeon]
MSMSTYVEKLIPRNLVIESSRGAQVRIHVIEQGICKEGATKEIENELEELIGSTKPDLQSITKKIEEKLHTVLTSKHKLLIYLPLLNPRTKARTLCKTLRELLASNDTNTLQHKPIEIPHMKLKARGVENV